MHSENSVIVSFFVDFLNLLFCNFVLFFLLHSSQYSFYNEKLRRNEIASIELYEGSEQVNSTAFSSMGRDLLALPIAEQQSFIFPTGIGIMSDTETQKGITTKHILSNYFGNF